MKTKDKIALYLQDHPEGVNDSDLTNALGIANHAHTNSKCHQLVSEGYVARREKNGTLHNFWLGVPYQLMPEINVTDREMSVEEYRKQWYWEGNVQSTLVNYLKSKGYHVAQEANTQTHQRGIDIIAMKNEQALWITVKGYPRPKITTNPRLQAVHWFSSALYDIIKYREKDNSVQLAFALPDFDRYRNISKDVSWFKKASNFVFYWIKDDGVIEEE
jgi:hypothetical protein